MEGENNTSILELNPEPIAVGSDMTWKKYLTLQLAGGAVISVFAVAFVTYGILKYTSRPIAQVADTPTQNEILPDPFADIQIEARAAYVYDINTGKVLYEKDSEVQLPLASLTKLMTAVVGSEEVPIHTLIPISSYDLREEGDSGLVINERWRLIELIKFTLTRSSNDGAAAIASVIGSELIGYGTSDTKLDETDGYRPDREAFITAMNSKAAALGLTQTYFLNPTGLDYSETQSGGYGSAKDMVNLFTYVLRRHPDLLKPTSGEKFVTYSENNIRHEAKNTNPVATTVPGLIGSKTGFTDLAGGNLVIGFDAGIQKPVVIAVLGSTEEGRFEDVEKLYWAALKKIQD